MAAPRPEGGAPQGLAQAPLLGLASALWGGTAVAAALPAAPAAAAGDVALLGALAVAGAGFAARPRPVAATVLCLLAAASIGALGRPRAGADTPLAAAARSFGEERLKRPVRLEGVLLEAPRTGRENTVLPLRVEVLEASRQVVPAPGEARITVAGTREPIEGLAPGARLSLWARVSEPRPPANPGGRALTGPLALFGNAKSGLLVEEIESGSRIARGVERIRGRIRERLVTSGMSPEVVGVVAAILIGDRTLAPPAVERAFRDAGTLHLMAVSGLHTGLLGLLVYGLAMLVTPRRRVALAAVVVVLPAYAALCGGSPSVLRAVIMAGAVIVGSWRGLSSGALNGLGAAAIVLLAWSPGNALDVGFQLSFAATLAIVAALRPPDPATVSWDPPPRPRSWLLGPMVVTLAAHAATFPIVAWHFARVVFGGVLASVPAGLLAGPVLGLGFGWLALGTVPGAGPILWRLMEGTTEALIGLSRWGASLPFGAFAIARPSALWVAAWALLAVVALSFRGRKRAGCAACLVALSLLTLPRGGPADGTLRFTALDVGLGDALVIGLPEGGAVLVDAGTAFAGFSAGERVIVPFLAEAGYRRLRAAAATHGDLDHVGGFPAVFREVPVEELWEGPSTATDERRAVLALHAERKRQGIPVRRLAAGDRFELGGAAFSVLFAGNLEGRREEHPNDRSLVLAVDYGGRRLLLTGDAGRLPERLLLDCCRADLRADVLKVGHHGSRTSTSPALLEAVQPAVAVVSTRADERLAGAGVRVYRTDEAGAVTVLVGEDGSLGVETFRTSSPKSRTAPRSAASGSSPFR